MDKKTIKEELIPIHGTTKLWIGDPWYVGMKNEKEIIFNGNISSAPLGVMKICDVEIEYEDITLEMIEVTVLQASSSEKLKTYLENKYYIDTIKKDMELGCDTACFEVKTKFGSDHFDTGGDGYYGHITQYKQYFGMKLELSFDKDRFSYDEVKERMLKLFKEDKKNGEIILASLR